MISGRSMAAALERSGTQPLVTDLVLKADSVILYRSSPAQKAEMVELIKMHARGKKTLAIGDGANDVNMIIRAHIGVGILSKEGNQASSFADYSIPQYKHLRRLLFWHGRPFGERLMNAVVWLIYRCMTFSICIFYLNLQNGFSGQQPIESLVFAIIYVNMTPIVLYIYIVLEVEVNRKKYGENEELLSYTMSELYQHTRQLVRKLYRTYLSFVLMSFYTGAVIFAVYFLGIDEGGILSTNGQTQDLFSFGVITIMVFVFQHHLHLAFMMRNWTVHYALLWLFSLAQVFLTYLVAESMMSSQLTYSVSRILWTSPHFWLQIFLATFVVTCPFYIWKCYKFMIRDTKFLAED